MISLPSLNFSSKKQRNDFDSILPLTNKSSKPKQSSLLGYIYDTSATIGTVITESCQTSLAYVSDVAGSIVKYGKSTSTFLPKTQQDTIKQPSNVFNPFERSNTPTTTPIVAENEGKWLMTPFNSQSQFNNHEIKIKTPSTSVFHSY